MFTIAHAFIRAHCLRHTGPPRYVVDWIEGAHVTHNLSIDFVSVWNEMDHQLVQGGPAYVKELRKQLDTRGFSGVHIVAYDGHSFGEITSAFANDPELEAAVYVPPPPPPPPSPL
jgi:hypothetical protein